MKRLSNILGIHSHSYISSAPLAVAIVAQIFLVGAVTYVSWRSDNKLLERQRAQLEEAMIATDIEMTKGIADTAAYREIRDKLRDGTIKPEEMEESFSFDLFSYQRQPVQIVYNPDGKVAWVAQEGKTVDNDEADALCAPCRDIFETVRARNLVPDNSVMDDLFDEDTPYDLRPPLPEKYPAIATLKKIDGKLAFVSGAIITSMETKDRIAGPAFVLASYASLDEHFSEYLSSDMGLSGLTFGEPAKGQFSIPLISQDTKQVVGQMSWNRETPAMDLLKELLPLVVLFMLVFTGLVYLLVRWLRRVSIDQMAGEALSSHLALHDPLTGLGNRAFLSVTLDGILPRVHDGKHKAALLLMDMDGFKSVNDSYGHQVGDDLIRQFSDRLIRTAPRGSAVVRLGGDEFAVILQNTDDDMIATIGAAILKFAREPFQIDSTIARIGCSIGVAQAPIHATDRSELLRKADVALYRAKHEGRNRLCMFEDSLDEGVKQRREAEDNLRQALASDTGFGLSWQPVYSIASGQPRLCGQEAVLLWNHSTAGLVSAREMTRIAEDVGLAEELGTWTLRRACLDSLKTGDTTITVNVTPQEVVSPNFCSRVLAILEETRFPARRLELELNDGMQHANSATALQALRQLRSAGIRLSLDEFGSGYANLGQLRTLPLSQFKISPLLLRGLEGHSDAQRIVSTLVALGQSIGLTVAADGVNSAFQLNFLQEAGCTLVQGSLFANGAEKPSTAQLAGQKSEAA